MSKYIFIFFLSFLICLSCEENLIEWCQKKKKKIIFKTKINNKSNSKISFSSILLVDSKKVAFAIEESKKKAEEKVSKIYYETIKIN